MGAGPKVDVSVVIPTYNRAHLLPATIDSVLAQTVRAREVLVIDDGSTDNSFKAIKAYRDDIKYYFQKNQGVSAARNHGIRLAQSKYIAFLDSDDLWMPDKLERQFAVLEQNPRLVAHVCNVSWFSKDGTVTQQSFWRHKGSRGRDGVNEGVLDFPLRWVLQDSVAVVQAIMVRTDTLKTSGWFDPALSLWEDTDFAARVAFCGPWGFTISPLVKVRNINEDTDRLSSARTKDLIFSLKTRRDVLNALIPGEDISNRDRAIIKEELALTNYSLGGAYSRAGAVDDACRHYLRSFQFGLKLKSAIMFFVMRVTGGNHLHLRKYFDKFSKLVL